MKLQSRRSFLTSLAGLSAAAWFGNFSTLRAAESGKVKITDIKTMLLNGPRTYTLVKVETDAGLYGIAEAYGSPGLGIVDAIHGVKEFLIGRDPWKSTDSIPVTAIRMVALTTNSEL